MGSLRIAAAQLNPVVGDLAGNVTKILDALKAAKDAGADLLVTPELALTGYLPEDLLLKEAFIAEVDVAIAAIVAATSSCAIILGTPLAGHLAGPLGPTRDARSPLGPASEGPRRPLANGAVVASNGVVLGTVAKQFLPNYGVFDEQRWFQPATAPAQTFVIGASSIGVVICEDLWADGPSAAVADLGAEVICAINASPFSVGRHDAREALAQSRAAATSTPILYVNQVGGQDELVFDGQSFLATAEGIVARASAFTPELLLIDDVSTPQGPLTERRSDVAETYDALVLGVADYFAKNRFSDAVIGLSGGIDSSLVAAVAVDALGADHVHGIAMPSRYSSDGSLTDADALAARLGVTCDTIPIEPGHVALSEMLTPLLGGDPTGLTDENLQSRLRGVTLMALSNAKGWIVLTTGNKSEMAVGYSTLYGDSAGGFAVIKDCVKTLVYDLCRYRNDLASAGGQVPPIPEAVLTKPPSAELRPDQRDDQSLPPYEILDPIIEAYVEDDLTAPEIVALGFDPAVVDRVVGLIDGAEYKRRQSPLGVRITTKAFGRDRRLPITNRYRPRGAAS